MTLHFISQMSANLICPREQNVVQILRNYCCMVDFRCVRAPNLVRLAQNGTNIGLFKISFSTFRLAEPKRTEADFKKSNICPILGLSDQIWSKIGYPSIEASLYYICIYVINETF